MPLELFFFLFVYFALLLLLSFFFSRKMSNLEDFFLASRNLSSPLVYVSLVASWFGATSMIVSTDEAYNQGLSSFWVMGVPAMLTVLLLGFFFARPIRRLPFISLPDLVEMRYGRLVRHMASLLIIWYMVLLASSQMVAVGSFLKTLLGTSYFYSLLLGVGVVLLYSTFGGFFSVVVTDGLQFFLLITGILGLFFFLTGTSSLKEVSQTASQFGKGNYFYFFYEVKEKLLIVLSFTLAWTISPIAWQRIQAARTEKAAKMALFFSSGTFLLFYGILVFIGILSLPIFLSESLDGPLLSEIISSKTGVFLSGFLFVAIVAAIMSTMDTAINTGALSMTRDVYQQIFTSSQGREVILVSRISTFLVGALAFAVALKLQSILKTLGLASEIMAAGLFVPGVAMIFLRKKLPKAGLLSLLLGGGFSLLGFLCEVNILPFSWPSWPYSVPFGIGFSLVGFSVGAVMDKFWRSSVTTPISIRPR